MAEAIRDVSKSIKAAKTSNVINFTVFGLKSEQDGTVTAPVEALLATTPKRLKTLKNGNKNFILDSNESSLLKMILFFSLFVSDGAICDRYSLHFNATVQTVVHLLR